LVVEEEEVEGGLGDVRVEGREGFAKSVQICRQELVRPASSDTRVEVDDLVERCVLGEVEVVAVPSETSSEGDGEFRLEELDHAIGVDAGDGEGEPEEETVEEAASVCRNLREKSVSF
jgi:hypothetical protein